LDKSIKESNNNSKIEEALEKENTNDSPPINNKKTLKLMEMINQALLLILKLMSALIIITIFIQLI